MRTMFPNGSGFPKFGHFREMRVNRNTCPKGRLLRRRTAAAVVPANAHPLAPSQCAPTSHAARSIGQILNRASKRYTPTPCYELDTWLNMYRYIEFDTILVGYRL
jgi:hypothetical protein